MHPCGKVKLLGVYTGMTEVKGTSGDDGALEYLGRVRTVIVDYLCDDDIALAIRIMPSYAEPRARVLYTKAYASNPYIKASGPRYPDSIIELMKVFACRECGVGCRFMARGLCAKCDPCKLWTTCDKCGAHAGGFYSVVIYRGNRIRLCGHRCYPEGLLNCQLSSDPDLFGKCTNVWGLVDMTVALPNGDLAAFRACTTHINATSTLVHKRFITERDTDDIGKCLKYVIDQYTPGGTVSMLGR